MTLTHERLQWYIFWNCYNVEISLNQLNSGLKKTETRQRFNNHCRGNVSHVYKLWKTCLASLEIRDFSTITIDVNHLNTEYGLDDSCVYDTYYNTRVVRDIKSICLQWACGDVVLHAPVYKYKRLSIATLVYMQIGMYELMTCVWRRKLVQSPVLQSHLSPRTILTPIF